MKAPAPKKKDHKRTRRRTPRRWLGPPRQSTFVFLFGGRAQDRLYAVRNNKGRLGAPGGKRDDGDASLFAAARREFREETGALLPSGKYDHFEWGDPYHIIRIFFRNLSKAQEKKLPVGRADRPGESEVETLWTSWTGTDRQGFRPHIAKALAIFEAMTRDARGRLF